MCGKKFKGLFAASVFFGAIGAALGVLFAPRKGKELRQKLIKEHQEGGDVKELIKEDLKMIGKDMKETAKQIKESPKMQELIGRGHKKAKEFMNISYDKLKELAERAGMTVDEFLSSEDFTEEMEEKFGQTKDALMEKAKMAKQKLNNLKHDAKKKVDDAKNKLKKKF